MLKIFLEIISVVTVCRCRILEEDKAVPEVNRAGMGAKHKAESGRKSEELSH